MQGRKHVHRVAMKWVLWRWGMGRLKGVWIGLWSVSHACAARTYESHQILLHLILEWQRWRLGVKICIVLYWRRRYYRCVVVVCYDRNIAPEEMYNVDIKLSLCKSSENWSQEHKVDIFYIAVALQFCNGQWCPTMWVRARKPNLRVKLRRTECKNFGILKTCRILIHYLAYLAL